MQCPMKRCLAAAVLIAAASGAQAVDSFTLEVGGGKDVLHARAGATWQWNVRWLPLGHWHLTGYWEANAGAWEVDGPGGRRVYEAGFTPVFRLRPNAIGGTQPYWEAALGLRLVSRTRLNDRIDLGDNLLLSEHLGFGVTFGEKTRYDLGYRLQHTSNAGLRDGGDGVTLHQLRLSYLY